MSATKEKTRKVTSSTSPKRQIKTNSDKKDNKKNLSASYNKFKEYNGKDYSSMQTGRSHHWKYDAGDWRATKTTPDLWEISYAVTKRRAPEGSGVPVGTGYHWYILAHQHVDKMNANDYSTAMTGLKFKLAHKRISKNNKWNVSVPTQRKHLTRLLKDIIAQLGKDPIPLEFEYDGEVYKGEGIPIAETCQDDICYEVDITLNDQNMAAGQKAAGKWIVLNEDWLIPSAIRFQHFE